MSHIIIPEGYSLQETQSRTDGTPMEYRLMRDSDHEAIGLVDAGTPAQQSKQIKQLIREFDNA